MRGGGNTLGGKWLGGNIWGEISGENDRGVNGRGEDCLDPINMIWIHT